jgi:hypothetical protein
MHPSPRSCRTRASVCSEGMADAAVRHLAGQKLTEHGNHPTLEGSPVPDIDRAVSIGDALRSHTDEARATEVAVAAKVPNCMLDLGRPNSIRVA